MYGVIYFHLQKNRPTLKIYQEKMKKRLKQAAMLVAFSSNAETGKVKALKIANTNEQ